MNHIFIIATFSVCVMAKPTDDWGLFKWKFQDVYGGLIKTNNDQQRMDIFLKNKKMISAHNAKFQKGQVTYSMKMNQFGALRKQEVMSMVLNSFDPVKNPPVFDIWSSFQNMFLPATVDWRTKGAVTPVKDQGLCGSCWAFTSTGALEAQNFLKTGVLTPLSEQNLVDCSRPYGNMGCDGGLMDQAFSYIMDHGINSEENYPYTGVDGTCQFDANNIAANVTKYVAIRSGDENGLKAAVAKAGPVPVIIDASQTNFQFYSSGIYNDPLCSSQILDHAVLIVGYGTQLFNDYWLVKNSWGTDWGEAGYVKMARNKKNHCGIASLAVYPTI